jgi:hypothetical protein
MVCSIIPKNPFFQHSLNKKPFLFKYFSFCPKEQLFGFIGGFAADICKGRNQRL